MTSRPPLFLAPNIPGGGPPGPGGSAPRAAGQELRR
jgi:hypothetical protein